MDSAIDWRLADFNQILGEVRERNRLYQENVVLRRLAQKAQMFYVTVTAFWDGDVDRDQVAWAQSELLDALAEWTRLDGTKEE